MNWDLQIRHSIVPESYKYWKALEAEGKHVSRFPDEWIPKQIQLVDSPIFHVYSMLGSTEAKYLDEKASRQLDSLNKYENRYAVMILERELLHRTSEIDTPITQNHKSFEKQVKTMLARIMMNLALQEKAVGQQVNVYLLYLFETKLSDYVSVGARMATYAVPIL